MVPPIPAPWAKIVPPQGPVCIMAAIFLAAGEMQAIALQCWSRKWTLFSLLIKKHTSLLHQPVPSESHECYVLILLHVLGTTLVNVQLTLTTICWARSDILVMSDVYIPSTNGTSGVYVATRVPSGGCSSDDVKGIYLMVDTNGTYSLLLKRGAWNGAVLKYIRKESWRLEKMGFSK